MTDRLTAGQIALLAAYAAAMAGGQLLFKLAAVRGTAGRAGAGIAALVLNGYFVAAVILYAALTVLWVWILSFTPLSRAYPFVALAFALTPALGAVFLSEPVSARLVIGVGLILAGLLFVAE
jgi:drug/metabolite transporter (DMT)-like permease